LVTLGTKIVDPLTPLGSALSGQAMATLGSLDQGLAGGTAVDQVCVSLIKTSLLALPEAVSLGTQ
jgi:hypothetical protein